MAPHPKLYDLVLLHFAACSNPRSFQTPARFLSWDHRQTGRGHNLTLKHKKSVNVDAYRFPLCKQQKTFSESSHWPCPVWASGTLSLMILQASYTGVDGSNCIVFTTLHWRTHIFSDNATILVGSLMASPTYTAGKHRRRKSQSGWSHTATERWTILGDTIMYCVYTDFGCHHIVIYFKDCITVKSEHFLSLPDCSTLHFYQCIV